MRCGESPEHAADQYERLLHARFRPGPPAFDLVFLGLGENGHTASHFPDTSVVEEQKRWVAAVYLPEQDLYRVTLTALAINMAKKIVFLVSGRDKARALKAVLEGPKNPGHIPAQLIKPPYGELIWLVDHTARQMHRQQRAGFGALSLGISLKTLSRGGMNGFNRRGC